MEQAAVVGTGPADSASSLSTRTYRHVVAAVVLLTFAFRVAFAARGSFTGDDFSFRAAMAGPFSIGEVFAGHNGHLNPIGLTLQWLVQHLFPGRFVPLMVLSAALVCGAQILASVWTADVFGRRWLGVAAVAMTGLSPMLIELATWWSVSLYAAPMVFTAWLTVLVTTRHCVGRSPLWLVVVAFGLCLLSSTKAVFLPLVLLGLVAGLGLGRSEPLGFRRALVRYRRMWGSIALLLGVYAIVYLLNRGPVVTADPSLAQVTDFVRALFRIAVWPAVWGGPWTWVSLGFHGAPAPSPTMSRVATTATVLGLVVLLAIRPRTWRVALMCGGYMAASASVVAMGRAGSSWGAPVLRYTFDLALPVILVICAGLASTRWEDDVRSDLGRRVARLPGRRLVGAAVAVAWIASLVVTYAVPWSILPDMPMKRWVAAARSSYPQLQHGLLRQPAPRQVAVFPEDLDVFLAGDPGKPPEVRYVMDRVLGFDGEGRVISREVVGIQAVALGQCSVSATKLQDAAVPLVAPVPPGTHVLALDYSLNLDTAAEVGLGDGNWVPVNLPAGVRRVYVAVDGGGDSVRVRVGEPNASLCVLTATVGDLVDGPLVELGS